MSSHIFLASPRREVFLQKINEATFPNSAELVPACENISSPSQPGQTQWDMQMCD